MAFVPRYVPRTPPGAVVDPGLIVPSPFQSSSYLGKTNRLEGLSQVGLRFAQCEVLAQDCLDGVARREAGDVLRLAGPSAFLVHILTEEMVLELAAIVLVSCLAGGFYLAAS